MFSTDVSIITNSAKKVAYFPMPKVATNSIRRAFFASKEMRDEQDKIAGEQENSPKAFLFSGDMRRAVFRTPNHRWAEHSYIADLVGVKGISIQDKRWMVSGYDEGVGFHRKPISIKEINNYFIFTFVRNPFSRLVSCFQGKMEYHKDKKIFLCIKDMQQAYNFPAQANDFRDFACQVCATPGEIANGHFIPQHLPVDFFIKLGGQFDRIGHYENLGEVFGEIQQKYGLLPLERTNTSEDKAQHKDWRDYYTPEIAKFVYEYYAQDFKQFGYEEEYPKLLSHLEKTSLSNSVVS